MSDNTIFIPEADDAFLESLGIAPQVIDGATYLFRCTNSTGPNVRKGTLEDGSPDPLAKGALTIKQTWSPLTRGGVNSTRAASVNTWLSLPIQKNKAYAAYLTKNAYLPEQIEAIMDVEQHKAIYEGFRDYVLATRAAKFPEYPVFDRTRKIWVSSHDGEPMMRSDEVYMEFKTALMRTFLPALCADATQLKGDEVYFKVVYEVKNGVKKEFPSLKYPSGTAPEGVAISDGAEDLE